MIRDKTIGIVIPAYNEEQGLSAVLECIPKEIDRVFVVTNCCTDKTPEIAEKYGAVVIDQPVKGYGSAYKAGFAIVDTDIVCTVDADRTHPVQDIPRLVHELFDNSIDFISARRISDDHFDTLNNIIRFTGNFVLTVFTVLLFWKKIMDTQSGMWVFHRKILENINLTSDGMSFSEEIKIEAWCNIDLQCAEIGIPFKYSNRIGNSKLNLWRDGFRNLAFLFAKRIGVSNIMAKF